MFDAQDEIDRRIASITLPFITLHGTGNTLVDIESSQFLNDNAQSEDKTFEAYSMHACVIWLTALLECLNSYEHACVLNALLIEPQV